MKDIKVVFMGTPSFAVPVLENLIKETNVILLVSQPDREKDRKGNILPTPTKKIALENNIEVFQPTEIKESYEKIISLNPDIIITCAYGQIIPEIILNCPKYGCINVHGSLLPKLRGGAPIHHAIINGDKKTGITIMYIFTIFVEIYFFFFLSNVKSKCNFIFVLFNSFISSFNNTWKCFYQ